MSTKLRRRGLAAAVVAIALLASACSSSKSTGGGSGTTSAGSSAASSTASKLPAEIQLHAISDQSGANAAVGISELNGWKLGVSAVNSAGLLGSSKLVLSSDDSQSTATQAASLASQAVTQKYPVVMYGPSSALAVAMAPIFAAAKQNTVFVQAGSSGIVVGPTIFRLTPTLDTYHGLALKYLQGKNVKTLADIYLNDNPTYTGLDKLLSTSASTYGYTYGGNVGVTTTQTNVSAAVSKLAGLKTDAVSILMNGAAAATVVGQLRQQGYKGIIISVPNIGANNVLGAVGDAANGVIWPTDWASTATTSASQKFVTDYTAANGKAPDVYAAEAYDSIFFIANSLKGAPSINQPDVTQAMTSLGTTGFSGVLGDKLSLKDNSEVSGGQLVQWQSGAIVAVTG